MRKEQKILVFFRMDSFLKEIIDKLAEDRKLNFSQMMRDVIAKGLSGDEYKELSESELEYIKEKKKEVKDDMLKYLRSKSAERIFFVKNIKKQIYLYAINRKDIDVKEVLNNMRLNLEISKNNGWTTEQQKIEEFLESIRTENPNILGDGEYDKKKIENDTLHVPELSGERIQDDSGDEETPD